MLPLSGMGIMRICIADTVDWDYHVGTPLGQPMGGMQSAACYLAMALAAQGDDVTLLNHTRHPGQWFGVECVSWADASATAQLRSKPFDAVVSLTANPLPFRELFGPGTRLLLWSGHADDQPPVQALAHDEIARLWDGFVFVSEWQRECFIRRFGLDRDRTAVLRNAVAPVFENQFASASELAVEKKTGPVRLAYTSTPYRGLQLLMAIFPLLERPARLEVYSSMATYAGGDTDVPYKDLYDTCRNTPGTLYVGAIPQPDLAHALKNVGILAYPNTFAETGCIAVMEAMASGCAVVTSSLGALPETTEGFATLISVSDDWYGYARKFLAALHRSMDFVRSDAGIEHLWRQVEHINATCTWTVRARQWVDLLDAGWGLSRSVAQRSSAPSAP
jgi:glycosyltransferase involved in cell wall biosynthesis